jgi:hypothetical protein
LKRWGAVAFFAVAAFATACPGTSSTDGSIIVGVTTDLQPGIDFDQLGVEVQVNGVTTESKAMPIGAGSFPLEIPVNNIKGGQLVEVDLKALTHGATLVERTQSTNAVAGKTLLLQMPLNRTCVTTAAPQCTSMETCAGGHCIGVFVDPKMLPAYTKNWASSSNTDICKPPDFPPVIDVGQGQADYLPTMDGDVANVEAGPQGGYHVWLAFREKGLRQSGSITTVMGHMPALNYDVSPYSVVFSFDPTEGGYCKLYGLRFRLDDPTHPVSMLLGQELDITVEVKDSDGTVGTGKRTVTLSSSITSGPTGGG